MDANDFKLDAWDVFLFVGGLTGSIVAGVWLGMDVSDIYLAFAVGIGLMTLRRQIAGDPALHYEARPEVGRSNVLGVVLIGVGVAIGLLAVVAALLVAVADRGAEAGRHAPMLWLVVATMASVGALLVWAGLRVRKTDD